MSAPLILYVEDEEADVVILQYALERLQIGNTLQVVANGEQALAYLKGIAPYQDRNQYPLPGLILLDLNIPRIPGIKVLEWIRMQPQFAEVPVLIYSSSEHPDDMERTRQLGANDYIVKPCGVENTLSTVRKMRERWLSR